ncbi:MAG TPA: aldose epimerase family protein [Pirellulaceae bacterium]|nr:aldose epimerase family protein [Pirellulaceae bacterium]HMO91710.1 aldose epimerase family protein [Pirellulaceae bacterium]HMP68406.1 aldose epimerase family protein [Pirellulaceae bacterium]
MKILLCVATFLLGLSILMFSQRPITIADVHQPSSTQGDALATENPMDVRQSHYGNLSSGAPVQEFVCTNRNGIVMRLINYGATMTSLEVPSKQSSENQNIILTCPDLAGFEACRSYFGSTVGRYCNRIAFGRFSIDGKEFQLATNNGAHHLHGGDVGFDKVVWDAEPIRGDSYVGVRFTYVSADGEEGYPGKLSVTADYILNNQDEIIVDLKAKSDQATHVNLTNHNYWNLAGAGAETILNHEMKVEASKFIDADETLIPTGKILDVKDTVFDFTKFRKMGDRINEVGDDPRGFDLCFAIDKQDGSLNLAATVKHEATGRMLEIWSTQPGLQFYTGNFLDGSPGSGGYQQYTGFCLETQHYPDTPNHPNFPSTLLKPGETFHQRTVHKFRVFSE